MLERIRLRLAMTMLAVCLAAGATLLAVTFAVWQGRTGGTNLVASPAPAGSLASPAVRVAQHGADRRELLSAAGIALGVMGALSLALGWLVAGRLLRPLRTITATTGAITAGSLHRRLNLRGREDELTELADTVDALLERLERSFAAERRFVADASHELRTPLAGMRASLDVAMAKPGPVPEHFATLDARLRRELDQLERLLDSLLRLARAQHAPLDGGSTCSLSDLARDALARHPGEIDIEERLSADARVCGDETLLARMVDNVIGNAVEHNMPGGWLRVSTGFDGERARLVVENAGPVIDPAEAAELTRPFRRVARTGSGTGLGLAIVASIVEVHGGSLTLNARAEGGLRVEIAL
jgi:signal transduction histidine kinase